MIYLELFASREHKAGLKKITEELDIPAPFLGKILQSLVKYDFLESNKGPHGGFCLKRPAIDITLLEVVEVIDGKGFWENCAIRTSPCNHREPCSLHHKLAPMREDVRRLYATETIGDLVSEFKNGRKGIRI